MSLRPRTTYNQYRGHVLTEPPATEPVSVADLKSQLRIDDSTEDALLATYIEAARGLIEEFTGLAFIAQEWRLTLDHWPAGREPWWDGIQQGAIGDLYQRGRAAEVFMPRYPLAQVDEIRVFDLDGSPTVVNVADTFIVDTAQRPGRLVLKFGATWPVVLENATGIEIEYTAGYTAAAVVPAPMRLAVLQMAAYMYEHRGDCAGADAYAKSGAKSLIAPFVARGL
jgi:uncharacterized phiE125 gp8 family phage protein